MQWHRRTSLSRKKRIEQAERAKKAHTWGGPVTVRKMTEQEWENRKMSKPQYNEHGGIIHQVEGVVGVGSDSGMVDPTQEEAPAEDDQ